jgi:hypothetical protein
MKRTRLGWSLLVLLSIIIPGCAKDANKGPSDTDGEQKNKKASPPTIQKDTIPGGYATPDQALNAYVQALASLDVEQFKKLFTYFPKRVNDLEAVIEYGAKMGGPAGVEAWKDFLKFTYQNEWTEGRYKKFPAEIEQEKAKILCAHYDPSIKETRYRLYDFKKVNELWYQTDWHVLDRSKVDSKKYNWEKK